jgi:inosine/xanthosine triphosphate pyrophosphatase family protein
MPYSGIFVPEGQDLVWAEMSTEYENKISHRGKAFRQARGFLESVANA